MKYISVFDNSLREFLCAPPLLGDGIMQKCICDALTPISNIKHKYTLLNKTCQTKNHGPLNILHHELIYLLYMLKTFNNY